MAKIRRGNNIDVSIQRRRKTWELKIVPTYFTITQFKNVNVTLSQLIAITVMDLNNLTLNYRINQQNHQNTIKRQQLTITTRH